MSLYCVLIITEKGAFGSLEVIEVSGAWKVTDNGKQETNGPAADEGTQTHNASKNLILCCPFVIRDAM